MGAGELPAGVSGAVVDRMVEESGDQLTIGERVIRNQVLTRGAPIAGRAAIAVGASALAGGIALQRKPATLKGKTRFSPIYLTKKQARAQMKLVRGTHMDRKYGPYYGKEYWKTTKHATQWSIWSEHTQEKKFYRRLERRRKVNLKRGAILRGAGGTMIVAGKLLPVLAYGYVIGDMLKRMSAGEDVNVQAETETLLFGATLEEHARTGLETYSRASIVYHGVVKPVATAVLRHETGGILG